ncbi:hypothetical protein GOBAR_DD16727 [Gossypium barbadense]|nr:hypothetical protein GOBAR_DD16727 [Gossypium barbadense]
MFLRFMEVLMVVKGGGYGLIWRLSTMLVLLLGNAGNKKEPGNKGNEKEDGENDGQMEDSDEDDKADNEEDMEESEED